MFVDLMSTTTSDGIVIDGAFFEPARALSRQGPVDALLLIHGSGGRFYAPATKAMAQDLREQGYACLALNTRGTTRSGSTGRTGRLTATPMKSWTPAAWT
jgi:alpha-beta hydrolase superfamily lysophospholipase